MLANNNNQVIITGRHEERLHWAVATLPNTTAIVSDLSDEKNTEALVARIKKDFPQLNILINNGAAANIYPLLEDHEDSFEKITHEIHINYLSVIRLKS